MSELFLYTPPRFTAPSIARAIGNRLGRRLKYQEADDLEDLDGSVDVTARIHIQVGADYLVVCDWESETVLKSWPPQYTILSAFKNLQEALGQFPEDDRAGPEEPEGDDGRRRGVLVQPVSSLCPGGRFHCRQRGPTPRFLLRPRTGLPDVRGGRVPGSRATDTGRRPAEIRPVSKSEGL